MADYNFSGLASTTSGSRGGGGAFGSKPKPLPKPDPQAQLLSATPQYQDLINLLSGNILSSLQGPSSALQSFYGGKLNAFNQQRGVGGSGFADMAAQLGMYDRYRAEQEKATDDLLRYLTVQSQTATLNPNLASEINEFNSLAAAAPDPAAYARWAEDQFEKQRVSSWNSMSGNRPATPGISYGSTGGIQSRIAAPQNLAPMAGGAGGGSGVYLGSGPSGAIPAVSSFPPAPSYSGGPGVAADLNYGIDWQAFDDSSSWLPSWDDSIEWAPSAPTVPVYGAGSDNGFLINTISPQYSPGFQDNDIDSILYNAGIPMYDYA